MGCTASKERGQITPGRQQSANKVDSDSETKTTSLLLSVIPIQRVGNTYSFEIPADDLKSETARRLSQQLPHLASTDAMKEKLASLDASSRCNKISGNVGSSQTLNVAEDGNLVAPETAVNPMKEALIAASQRRRKRATKTLRLADDETDPIIPFETSMPTSTTTSTTDRDNQYLLLKRRIKEREAAAAANRSKEVQKMLEKSASHQAKIQRAQEKRRAARPTTGTVDGITEVEEDEAAVFNRQSKWDEDKPLPLPSAVLV